MKRIEELKRLIAKEEQRNRAYFRKRFVMLPDAVEKIKMYKEMLEDEIRKTI